MCLSASILFATTRQIYSKVCCIGATTTEYSIAIFAEVYRPNDVRMAMDLHYYYGDCNTPEAQAQIKQNFIEILNVSTFSEVCQDPSLKEKCNAENVKVTCSEVEFVISRKKRSAGEFNPYWVFI